MFSIGPSLTDQYFGLADEVNALAATSAIAPFIQSTNALATWKTDQIGPLSEHNLLKNNVVLLDDTGNMDNLSSLKFIPKPTQTDPTQIYINQNDGRLYRGGIDLEIGGSGGNVLAPPSQTTDAISTWNSTANTLNNSTVILDSAANISEIGTLKLLDKTGISDPNTLWINALDGHLYRGTEDIELDGGNVTSNIPLGTANPGYVIVSSGTTGDYIAEAPIDTSGGDLSIMTAGKKLKMRDDNSGNVLPILYGTGLSTVVGFGNGFNNPISANEVVAVGRDNDVSGQLESSTVVGNSNFGSLTSTSLDNITIGHYCASSLITGGNNVMVGNACFGSLATGTDNYGFGTGAGADLINGSGNLYLGDAPCLATESNILRVGNSATSRTYIKGIYNQTLNDKGKIPSIVSGDILGDSDLFYDTSPGNLGISQTTIISQNVGVANTISFGLNQLLVSTTASANVLFGNGQLTTATTGCNSNNVFGVNSLIGCTSGISNNCVYGSQNCIQFGASNLSGNVIMGNSCMQSANGAVNCIAIGNGSGSNVTDNANNILIASPGLASEDNSIRIGTVSTHDKIFLQGITSSVLSNKKMVVTDSATGQLGYENPMHMLVAESYFENFTVPYNRTLTINVPAEIAYTQTLISNMAMDFDVSVPGRLKWNGADTLLCHAAFSFSASLASGVNENFAFYCAINGVKVTGGEIRRRMTNSVTFEMITWHKVITLTTGQYLSCFATNLSGSNSLNFGNCNQVIMSTH